MRRRPEPKPVPSASESAVIEFLRSMIPSEDHGREGLHETPRRVIAAWQEWTSGYGVDPKKVLKSFADGAQHYDQLVLVSNIPVYSTCEHHLAPFWGLAHIGYIPSGHVVGLSKFPRLVDLFARRLQVQERLTADIAGALQEALQPVGVGVVIQCRHMCMESRGVRVRGSLTTTSALHGALKDNSDARAEFLKLVESGKNGVTI